MKIAVVGPVYPYRGGIAHYTTLLAYHLAQQHTIRVYTYRQQYPKWLFPGRSQLEPGAPLVKVDARQWLIPWWPWTWWKVRRDWSIWRPEVVVFQWWVPFMAPMTTWLARSAHRLNSRVVMICHNVLPHERSRIDQTLVRLALRRADQLIVHTHAQAELAHTLLLGHTISVIPHPTYADFHSNVWTREKARAALQLDGNVLLFFGLVRPYKGLLDLLDALPQVLSNIAVKLLVVGEIWGDAELYRARVRAHGLESQVQLVDRYVSNDETAMYFAAADLIILPYREATGSGVLQLAFGLGVPVVATRTGGMGEIVEDGVTGFLVEPGDVAGLVRAIARFFQEDRASSFRAAIGCAQAHFGWKRLVDVILVKS